MSAETSKRRVRGSTTSKRYARQIFLFRERGLHRARLSCSHELIRVPRKPRGTTMYTLLVSVPIKEELVSLYEFEREDEGNDN